jgi:NADH:ubiquinone oxidoreductase subunit 4 (subunit M)
VKAMRCEIVISIADRRTHKALAGKVAVGLVSSRALGVDVATWYMLSHGVSLDTILRVLTAPQRRRR